MGLGNARGPSFSEGTAHFHARDLILQNRGPICFAHESPREGIHRSPTPNTTPGALRQTRGKEGARPEWRLSPSKQTPGGTAEPKHEMTLHGSTLRKGEALVGGEGVPVKLLVGVGGVQLPGGGPMGRGVGPGGGERPSLSVASLDPYDQGSVIWTTFWTSSGAGLLIQPFCCKLGPDMIYQKRRLGRSNDMLYYRM